MARYPLLAALLAACAPLTPPPAPPPTPAEADACEAFCGVQRHLGCEDAGEGPGVDQEPGTADDAPCEAVCRDMLAGGLYTADRACMDSARTCAAAEACLLDGDGGDP